MHFVLLVCVCVRVQPALNSTFNSRLVVSLCVQLLHNSPDLDHCVDACQNPVNVLLLLLYSSVSKEKIPHEIYNLSVRVKVEVKFKCFL